MISQYFTGGIMPDRAIPMQHDANDSGTVTDFLCKQLTPLFLKRVDFFL